MPDILADSTVQTLRQERAKLVGQYEDQLKTYKPDYPDMVQLKSQIDEIDRQLKLAADTVRASLKNQYQTALQQENALQGNVNTLKGSVLDLRTREIQYNILQREVDTNRTLYDGLLQRYKEIGVAGGVTSNNISVVDRAETPRRTVRTAADAQPRDRRRVRIGPGRPPRLPA
ncbi:MAG: GNVR domain-containing protein [Caulobacteraceae bacterium]